MSLAPHTLQIVGIADSLPVISVEGEETLGALYRYDIVCEAPLSSPSRTLAQALTQRCELRLGDASGDNPGSRSVWGLVTHASLHHRRGVPALRFRLEPRLSTLRHLRLNQVFLDQTSVQTVQAVLTQAGLSAQWQDWQTTATYPAFSQRTCHEQDALGFVLWLLEYEGIGLRFEHTAAGERLVFFDDLSGYDRSLRYSAGVRVASPAGLAADSDPETLTGAAIVSQATPGAVRLTEYDHQQAHLDLSVVAMSGVAMSGVRKAGSRASAANHAGDQAVTVQHHG